MNRIRSALFGLGIAGTLAFGAAQAFAAPGQAPRKLECNATTACYTQCGPYLGELLPGGRCECCPY